MIVVGSPLSSHASFAKFAVASMSVFLLSTFKSNQIVVPPPPHQDTQVTSVPMSTWHLVVQGIHNQASVLLSFSPGNLPSILQHYESWPSRRKPPDQNQAEFCQFCDHSVYCLQQWGLTHKFRGQLSTMVIVCSFQIWEPLTNNSKGKRPYPG